MDWQVTTNTFNLNTYQDLYQNNALPAAGYTDTPRPFYLILLLYHPRNAETMSSGNAEPAQITLLKPASRASSQTRSLGTNKGNCQSTCCCSFGTNDIKLLNNSPL